MKRCILFIFHKDFEVCQNHLQLLRRFNPNSAIYGLYSGLQINKKDLYKLDVDHLWKCSVADQHWCWKNQDLKSAKWFSEVGNGFRFDMAHVVAWDMLLLQSVDSFFESITDGIAITRIIELSKIYDTWVWTSGNPGRSEWLELLDEVRLKYNYDQIPVGCMGAGMSFSREFLTRYSEEEPSELCNDEVRLPLYAQCFHMPIHDSKMSNPFLKLSKTSLTESEINEAYKAGTVVFNPVRIPITINESH